MSDSAVILRVASKTPTVELASAVSHAVYDNGKVTLRAVGAGAVNQAVKAIAIASGYVAQRGNSLVIRVGFETVKFQDEERTAIVLHAFVL